MNEWLKQRSFLSAAARDGKHARLSLRARVSGRCVRLRRKPLRLAEPAPAEIQSETIAGDKLVIRTVHNMKKRHPKILFYYFSLILSDIRASSLSK
jgi:hypothetical protein